MEWPTHAHRHKIVVNTRSIVQGKNYTWAPGDIAPEIQFKRALENQKRAPENCHRLQCKSLYNVDFAGNSSFCQAHEFEVSTPTCTCTSTYRQFIMYVLLSKFHTKQDFAFKYHILQFNLQIVDISGVHTHSCKLSLVVC